MHSYVKKIMGIVHARCIRMFITVSTGKYISSELVGGNERPGRSTDAA